MARALADALRASTTLAKLMLDAPQFSHRFAAQALEGLEKNASLCHLALTLEGASKWVFDTIAKAMLFNDTFQSLSMEIEHIESDEEADPGEEEQQGGYHTHEVAKRALVAALAINCSLSEISGSYLMDEIGDMTPLDVNKTLAEAKSDTSVILMRAPATLTVRDAAPPSGSEERAVSPTFGPRTVKVALLSTQDLAQVRLVAVDAARVKVVLDRVIFGASSAIARIEPTIVQLFKPSLGGAREGIIEIDFACSREIAEVLHNLPAFLGDDEDLHLSTFGMWNASRSRLGSRWRALARPLRGSSSCQRCRDGISPTLRARPWVCGSHR